MRLLTFLCPRFAWTPASKTLPDAIDDPSAGSAHDAVVAFLHVEPRDTGEQRPKTVRHVIKHVKWIARKRQLRAVVLHSFTHLGGETAAAADAHSLLAEVETRLRAAGFEVQQTPFGWFCAWELSVHGDSVARVYKEL